MTTHRVSDLTFGQLTKKYGRSVSYEWEVHGHLLKFPTTRQLTSQRKFREVFLEASGKVLLRVSTEVWTMILNTAFATTEKHTEQELQDFWLLRVAQYCVENATTDQKEIKKGKVYRTNTGLLFTTIGLVNFLRRLPDMTCFTADWHHDKVLSLLNAKSVSVTLKDFKGRAVRINNFSCRVDSRFYTYYDSIRISYGKAA